MMAANLDTSAQLRYLATVRRQSAPPRCNPFVILLQVLAVGMVFIGLTMTIIAHWPGSTSIGENHLKIAGPIILSVGFVALIIGIVLVCIMNQRERVRWQTQMAKIIVGRQQANDVDQVAGNADTMVDYPSNTQDPASGAESYGGPVKKPRGYTDNANVNDSVFSDSDNIPMPVRVKKPRRPKDQSGDLSSTEDLTAVNDGVVVDETSAAAPKKRRRPKPDAAVSGEESRALMGDEAAARSMADSAAVQPSPNTARQLKVHIKAQPGSSVRIQNTPPPAAPKPAYRPKNLDQSTTSAETDI